MPVALGKEIARSWFFASSSGNGVYETLQYTDGSLSCGCKGWTRHVAAKGNRSCKHTRMVEQGVADRCAESTKDYTNERRAKPATLTPTPRPVVKQREPEPPRARSRFKPEEEETVSLVDTARFRKL